MLMLETAWAALLDSMNVHALCQLPQSSLAEVLLQPLASALRHKSIEVRDLTIEFWNSSGIQELLGRRDLGLVESALALTRLQILGVSPDPHGEYLQSH